MAQRKEQCKRGCVADLVICSCVRWEGWIHEQVCGVSDICNLLDRLCVQLYPVLVLYVDELIANVLPVVAALRMTVSAHCCTVAVEI